MKIDEVRGMTFFDSELNYFKYDPSLTTIKLCITYTYDIIGEIKGRTKNDLMHERYSELIINFELEGVDNYEVSELFEKRYPQGGDYYRIYENDNRISVEDIRLEGSNFEFLFMDSFGIRKGRFEKVKITKEYIDAEGNKLND